MSLQDNIKIDSITKKNIDQWLSGGYAEADKAVIRQLLHDNPKELVDAFYTTLSFGTGGLRGVMGIGSNRINNYTIRAATQGLANYIIDQPSPHKSHRVLIGYDSRHHSAEFAAEAAKVLAANGIRALIFKDLRPTPLVSFGCRLKSCSAAIMVTASHNPPQYNGYKVYWSDGGQVVFPHDDNIIVEVDKISTLDNIKVVDSFEHPLITVIESEIDLSYIEICSRQQNYRDDNQRCGSELNVVYTSLHGAGITLAPRVLASWGFTNLNFVEEQVICDGDFPTVSLPNPEERQALSLGIDKLQQVHGDLLIANDPDGDRVGVALLHKGKVELINGNQMAALLLEHVCKALAEKNKLPANAAFIKSLVTTELFQVICQYYQKPCFNVLPGFKYIAKLITQWEKERQGYHFIFGAEESYGYLYGSYSRDKDAIAISALICEMALQAKLQGLTLIDMRDGLYRKYGVYDERLLSISFEESKEGKEAMARGMGLMRRAPPKLIGDRKVVAVEDYQQLKKFNIADNMVEPLHLPSSNILLFWLDDGSKVVIRPSGTEPKIKIYCGVFQKEFTSVDEALLQCQNKAQLLIDALKKHFQR